MSQKTIEILVLVVGTLIYPIGAWFIAHMHKKTKESKNEILRDVKLLMNEYYQGLDDLITHNKNAVNGLKVDFAHQKELLNLKIEQLERHIERVAKSASNND